MRKDDLRSIKECVEDNLMIAKYHRIIKGYKGFSKKNYVHIYICKDVELNLDYVSLYNLFTKNQFETYIKIKGAKHEEQQEVCGTMGV